MNETDKSLKNRKRLKFFLIKLPIFFCCVLLVLILALKVVERYPLPLKEGFEKYLSESTGTNATIGYLEKIKLFPDFNIHMRELTLHKKHNAAEIALQADNVHIIIPLKNILIGGNTIKKLHFENFRSDGGLIFPQNTVITKADIVERQGLGYPPQYGYFIVAQGTYANSPFSMEAQIDKKGDKYIVPKQTSFNLQIGDLSLDAVLDKGLTSVNLENAVLARGNETGSARSYDLVESNQYTQDNPLSCMIRLGDSAECDIYINQTEESITP
jgi:hypothetical protein